MNSFTKSRLQTAVCATTTGRVFLDPCCGSGNFLLRLLRRGARVEDLYGCDFIEMKRASLELHNKPQHLFMRNINVMQESSVGPALSMDFDMRKDVRGVFMAKKETLLSLANVHAVNERGQSSVDIDRVNHHIVNVEKINFRLPERRE